MDGSESSRYKIRDDGNGCVELEAVHVPSRNLSASELVTAYTSNAMALGRRLADDFHVPWDLSEAMDSDNKELLFPK